ncbi:MAG: Hpt domain-containing protein [Gammaproteobacteria bacterium]|nr:Hpt domain-containing protein [Gammaproteobacteria bacterium]NNJ93709.1 hypothetical protein [Halobacteria archaeon]
MKNRSHESRQTDLQPDQEAFRQELDKLFRSYVLRLPEKLESIGGIVSSLHADRDTGGLLSELHMQVHKLAGSAGSYGCPDVGKVARDYEILINTHLNSGSALEPADYKRLENKFADLAAAIDQAVISAG